MKITTVNPNRVAEEVGRTNNCQPILHIMIRVGAERYRHYLDCPLLDKMIHIKGQTSLEIPSDVLEEKIQQFKKLLENQKGLH